MLMWCLVNPTYPIMWRQYLCVLPHYLEKMTLFRSRVISGTNYLFYRWFVNKFPPLMCVWPPSRRWKYWGICTPWWGVIRVRGGQMDHLLVNRLKFTCKCLIIQFFSIFMCVAILASASMVLKLGALVIFDGIKKFLTHVQRAEWARRGENGPLH